MKINLIIFIVLVCAINIQGITMENKLYHHLPDGKFRNPEGSPERKENVNWSFRTFNKEKKKLVQIDFGVEIEMTVTVTDCRNQICLINYLL